MTIAQISRNSSGYYINYFGGADDAPYDDAGPFDDEFDAVMAAERAEPDEVRYVAFAVPAAPSEEA